MEKGVYENDIKRRAVERDQKLKDTIAQLLEIGLANAPDHTP